MRVTKAQQRREKMAHFNAQVEAERNRLSALELSATELIEHFACGCFYTELAASQILYARSREENMEAILAGLAHSKWKVRRTCADFLDHWGDQRCIELLVRALRDPKEHVRRLAIHSLLCQQCKACPLEGDFVEPLIERALTDRSQRVRRIATGALGAFVLDGRAVAALRQIVTQECDPVVLERAQAALGTCVSPR